MKRLVLAIWTLINRWLDALACWPARRRGFIPLPLEDFTSAGVHAADLLRYIAKSGHLNTVSGRRPHAYKRLVRGLIGIARGLGLTQEGT